MKKIVLSILLMGLFALSHAQSPIAILTHNGNMTPYYGTSALVDAYAAADSGDVITLSPGVFTGVEIRKPLTLRGAGMMTDTAAGTLPTTITGTYKIHNTDTDLPMTIEGIYFQDGAYMDNIYNVTFSKCYINSFLAPFYGGGNITNGTFVHCIIPNIKASWLSNCHFYNSVVCEGVANGNWFQNSNGSTVLYNCIIQLRSITSIDNFHSYNSILLLDNDTTSPLSMTNTCENHEYCIGINPWESLLFFPESYVVGHHLHNVTYCYQLFGASATSFNHEITVFADYHLVEGVDSSWVGNDGTQIGIYGGAMPFNPKVNNPSIGHINVAGQTNGQGELPVNIEIVTE